MQQTEPTTPTEITTPVTPAVEDKQQPEVRPKASWIWIKDSSGYPSITVTFVTVAFWVTTLAYVAAIVEAIGPVKLRAFDAGASSAYFIPLLTLYFGRKFTDAKFNVTKGQ